MPGTPSDALLEVAKQLTLQSKSETEAPVIDAYARRATSTAYYAVFHLILDALDEQLSKTSWADLRHEIVRCVTHQKLVSIAASLDVKGANSNEFKSLCRHRLWLRVLENDPKKIGADLKRFAQLIVTLQSDREQADYNREESFENATAAEAVAKASEAFALWRGPLSETPAARVFLLALLNLEGRADQREPQNR
jgi:uncharacterized protein (UPF0332 family)